MSAERSDTPLGDPLAQLERALTAEFLRSRGYDPSKLHELPEAKVQELLKEASLYASAKLTEVESRAHFVHDIHGGGGVVPPGPGHGRRT